MTNASGSRAHIAVNLTWCIPGQVGGSEEYLCRQLVGLPVGEFDVTVFAPRNFRASHLDLASTCAIRELNHTAHSRLRRIVDESTWLYRRTRGAAVVHHGGGTVPVLHRGPILLTLHDLQYLAFPQYFSRTRLRYLRRSVPRAVKCASLIAVPTAFVRDTVIDAFGTSPEKVVVVPHGIEATLGRHATSEEELRRKYELGNGPILVFPAMTHPHKGHDFLIEVYRRHWSHRGVTLVFIGGQGRGEEALRQRLSEPNSTGIVRLGRVSTAERDGFVKMSSAVVFPSQYEGFGAPVIEAMALGTPVITSDRACLPEVVADAGLVLPLDIDTWGRALEVVQDRRADLISRGESRVRHFSSEASGRALAEAYRRLLASPVRSAERRP